MGSFSKNITADNFSDSLWDLFLESYRHLAKGVDTLDEDKQVQFTDKQHLELMIILMIAIMYSLVQKFGDTQEVCDVFTGMRNRFFERYFKESKEKKILEKLFLKRYDEYIKIINNDLKDSEGQFKQLFRTNYFGKMGGMNNFRVMMYVFTVYSIVIKNVSIFLEKGNLKIQDSLVVELKTLWDYYQI